MFDCIRRIVAYVLPPAGRRRTDALATAPTPPRTPHTYPSPLRARRPAEQCVIVDDVPLVRPYVFAGGPA